MCRWLCCKPAVLDPAVNPEFSAESFHSSEIPPGLKIMISDGKKQEEEEEGEERLRTEMDHTRKHTHDLPPPRATHTNLSAPPFASGPNLVPAGRH